MATDIRQAEAATKFLLDTNHYDIYKKKKSNTKCDKKEILMVILAHSFPPSTAEGLKSISKMRGLSH